MSAKRQILIELTEDTAAHIDELQTRVKAQDFPALFTKALALLDTLSEHEANGGLLFCKKADGSTERIIV